MPKFPCLLLDANVIIAAHELSIWDKLVERCPISVTRTVLEHETYYWRDKSGTPYEIDLKRYIREGKIGCIDVPPSQFDSFVQKFTPTYLDRMDPGETDSLAHLYHSEEKWYIASGDGIVFRTLGCLALSDQGISLEEILRKTGLTCELGHKYQQYTKKFRVSLTKKGEQEGIMGMGLKTQAEKDENG